MANYVRQVQHTEHLRGGGEIHTKRLSTVPQDAGIDRAQLVINYLLSALSAILALRLVLALFGANPANAFANFIYSISNPFVVPFRGLFGYTSILGQPRFEVETLVAMIVYALVAWGISALLDLGRSARTEVFDVDIEE